MKIKKLKWKLLSVLAVSAISLTTAGTVLIKRSTPALAENVVGASALFTSDADMDVVYGVEDENGNKGVSLTLNNMLETGKAVIEYNSYIAKEDIGGALIRFSVLPSDIGVQDFECVVVTATDVVDSTQQLSFAIAPQSVGWWTTYASSWVALTDELTPIRKSAYSDSLVLQLDGTAQNAVGINEFLGTSHGSYTGRYMDTGARMNKNGYFTRDNAETKMNSLRLAFDGTNVWRNGAVIACLSEPAFYEAQMYLSGTRFESRYTEEYVNNLFSSGYCKMKMTFLSPLTDTTKIHITQIGEKLFSSEADEAYAQPYFLIDKEKEAVCGYEYDLPNYIVKDARLGDLTQKTVCQLFDELGQEVEFSNNKVTFSTAGKYVMRLTVENNGATYTREMPITCYAEMPTTYFDIQDSLKSFYQTGEKIVLKEFRALSEVNCKNGGYLDAFTVLQREGETLISHSMDETVSYVLEKEGAYNVHYVAKNIYGIYETLTYSFIVEKGLSFVDYKEPIAFRKGQVNKISDFAVVNYANDVSENELYRSIYIDDTQIYLAQGDRVIFGSLEISEFASDNVQLIYKAGFSENELVYQKSFTVPVIETLYVEDWFIMYDEDGNRSEIGTFEDDAKKMIFNATKDGSLVFANYVATTDFSVQFALSATKDDFKSLAVVLQNPADSSEYVELELWYLNATQSLLFVNGKACGQVDGSMVDGEKGFFWGLSEDGKHLQTVDGTTIVALDRWSDGTAFDGFDDGALILKFVFDGIKADKTVPFYLSSISNQTFFTSYVLQQKTTFGDMNAPIIYTYGAFKNVEKTYGYTFYVPAATAYDVLQTDIKLRLRVLDPNDEYALVTNDLSVKNAVQLNAYGAWTFIITAEDVRTGNTSERRIVVTVKDKIPPEIKVSGKIFAQYSVGKKYTFASATATDNDTEDVQVILVIIWENGTRDVATNFQYKFTQKGKYRLMYYAIDESYNASKIIYEVTVK